MLPDSRPFKLGSLLGWGANLLGLAYVIITTVLFVFPPDLPVDGNNMSKLILSLPLHLPVEYKLIRATDYCIVVFFIILVISIVQWFIDGKKNFTGPKINIEQLANGMVMGMEPESNSSEGSANGYKDEAAGP